MRSGECPVGPFFTVWDPAPKHLGHQTSRSVTYKKSLLHWVKLVLPHQKEISHCTELKCPQILDYPLQDCQCWAIARGKPEDLISCRGVHPIPYRHPSFFLLFCPLFSRHPLLVFCFSRTLVLHNLCMLHDLATKAVTISGMCCLLALAASDCCRP